MLHDWWVNHDRVTSHSSLIKIDAERSTGTGICTSSPILTGYSRPHGESTSVNLTWQSLSCHSGSIMQYEVNFFGNCSTTPSVSLFTGSTNTSILINYPYCIIGGCYVRVRGELIDGLFTDYSPCVFIDNQLLHFESKIIQSLISSMVMILSGCGEHQCMPQNFL